MIAARSAMVSAGVPAGGANMVSAGVLAGGANMATSKSLATTCEGASTLWGDPAPEDI